MIVLGIVLTLAFLAASGTASSSPGPVVDITSPNNGTTVAGNQVGVAANASDASGIASVQFMLDGAPLAGPVTSNPYAIVWDTTAISDGQHALTAIATAVNGNSATSTAVAVTVSNNPPVVDSVSINQAAPLTNDLLTVTITAHDPAGQNLTYNYQWLRNGTNILGATSSTLDLSTVGNGDKGDAIALEVTASDGLLTSQRITSSPVTIVNSPPVATVTLSSGTPDTDVTIAATTTASDPDADPINLTYVWSVNGVAVRTTTTTGLTDSLNLSLPGNGNYGDTVALKVTPNDGVADGSVATATATVTAPATGTILEYAVGSAGFPSSITTGPDGNLWFVLESGLFPLGRISPAGTVSLLTLPQSGNLGGINPGPDGNIWFTESTNKKISNINPITLVVTRYSLLSGAAGIVAGSDGNMWFVESGANKIGRITMSGKITLFTVPTASSFPHGLNLGPNGNIWFCELNGNKIGQITPSGVITEYAVTTAAAKPYVIAAGSDGNMWFTESAVGKIGRITLSGVITEFQLPSKSASPFGISAGPDRNLWFAEGTANKIGRITTSGVVTEFLVPTPASQPRKIVNGPDGNLWFTERTSGKIGRITP